MLLYSFSDLKEQCAMAIHQTLASIRDERMRKENFERFIKERLAQGVKQVEALNFKLDQVSTKLDDADDQIGMIAQEVLEAKKGKGKGKGKGKSKGKLYETPFPLDETLTEFGASVVRCNPGQIDRDVGDQNKFDAAMMEVSKTKPVWPTADVRTKMGGSFLQTTAASMV